MLRGEACVGEEAARARGGVWPGTGPVRRSVKEKREKQTEKPLRCGARLFATGKMWALQAPPMNVLADKAEANIAECAVTAGRSLPPDRDLAPDLVVEVLSSNDRPGEVLTKVADWLSAGTSLVWVIDPERRLGRVYRDDGSEQIVAADQSLDGEDVVPGFSCQLQAIL